MDYNFRTKHHAGMILSNTNAFPNKNNVYENYLNKENKNHLLNTYQPVNNNYHNKWGDNNINYQEKLIEDKLQILNNNINSKKIKIENKGRRIVRNKNENKFQKVIDENKKKLEGTVTTKDSKNEDSTIKNINVKNIKKEINENDKVIFDKEKEIEEINHKLILCTEGCNRKFLPHALEKHKKNCKKLFLNKKNDNKKNLNRHKNYQNNKKNWKKESENFRAILKQVKLPELPKNDDEFDLSD